MTTKLDKTDIGAYLTLANGQEIQITGFQLSGNEGFFSVRYPDNLVSGDSYQLPEREIYAAKFSKKYEACNR
jgi:hypothetical protein